MLNTEYQRILEDLNNIVVCQRNFPLSSSQRWGTDHSNSNSDLNLNTVADLVKIWSAQVDPLSSELLLEGMAVCMSPKKWEVVRFKSWPLEFLSFSL